MFQGGSKQLPGSFQSASNELLGYLQGASKAGLPWELAPAEEEERADLYAISGHVETADRIRAAQDEEGLSRPAHPRGGGGCSRCVGVNRPTACDQDRVMGVAYRSREDGDETYRMGYIPDNRNRCLK